MVYLLKLANGYVIKNGFRTRDYKGTCNACDMEDYAFS